MEGYIQTISDGKIKRYVQFLEINDDPELITPVRDKILFIKSW